VLAVVLLALIASVASECQNDCNGHGQCVDDVCVCDASFAGPSCSQYLCLEHSDQCSDHGQCRETKCVCHDGYGGHNCAVVTNNCANHCTGHGNCMDGVCTCHAGYTGSDCSLVDTSISCAQNCSGHGFCDTSNPDSPTCVCSPEWVGDRCDVERYRCPSEMKNCSGHGVCAAVDSANLGGDWQCACEAGFCGGHCQRVCPSCPNNCTGHGLCVGQVCVCDAGFSGSDCSVVTSIPECPANCSGHGRCAQSGSSFACVCNPGFSGSDCGSASGGCPSNCSGKGECTNGRCHCMPGYNGTSCDRAVGNCAVSNFCSGNGVCVNGQCQCYPGFRDFDCSEACFAGISGKLGCFHDRSHGVCMNGTCICRQGEWEGEYCDTAVHEETLGSVTDANNPVGIIALSVVGCAASLLLLGFGFNHFVRGKKGFNAVPGAEFVKSKVKGDEYEAAPEKSRLAPYE